MWRLKEWFLEYAVPIISGVVGGIIGTMIYRLLS